MPFTPDRSSPNVAGNPSALRAAALRALAELPPLSAVGVRLQSMSNEDADMRKVASLLSADPALSADVLRLANSALFSARHRVSGILHALVMIGLERVRSLVFTSALARFSNPSASGAAVKRSWRHSVACAAIAEEIAAATGYDRDVAYTAGLLHDMGRLSMLRLWPDKYMPMLDGTIPDHAELIAQERRELGIPHTEAGAYLLRRWQLPELLVGAAQHHHDPSAPPIRELTGMVHHACTLADAVGFAVAGEPIAQETPIEWPEAARGVVRGNSEDLQFRVATRMNALECWL